MTERQPRVNAVAYVAAAWALLFGLAHVAWAAGWYIGLPEQTARQAFARTWFLVYDLVVVGVCAVAVPVGLGLVQPWGRHLPRALVGGPAWAGTALLAFRSSASLVHAGSDLADGTFVLQAMFFWEAWFYLGTVLFAVSTWRFWTSR